MLNKNSILAVAENVQIAKDIYQMKLAVDRESLKFYRPGQFLHIKVPGAQELLLRRPISVNDYNVDEGWIQIAYLVIGEGTRRLALLREGDRVDVLFPLGNSFKLEENQKKVFLVGGGIGIAPLLSVTTYYPDREYTALLGYRAREYVYQIEEFEKKASVFVTTDNGSYGQKGFATDLLAERIAADRPDVIFSCGPHCFFESLKKSVEGTGIPTYASLEQRMGCGTGGCSVCVCAIAGENKRICVEGPVFDLAEVEL
jgi:dihydroorotate dehydrogenase electron transfer subunit